MNVRYMRAVPSIVDALTVLLSVASLSGCVADLGASQDALLRAGDGIKVIARTRSSSAIRSDDTADRGAEAVGEAVSAINTEHGIDYHGGPVMVGQVKVYYIWYGNWSGNTATSILTDLANNITGSPYHNIHTLYDDSSGASGIDYVTYAGATADNYSQGATLSDAGVWSVVSNALSSGKLPVDGNAVYFVLASSDVGESSGFCTNYCGWHTYDTYDATTIKYSFVGNPATQCPDACQGQTASSPNGNPGADGMASVLMHELEEAVSDPQLNAWFDSAGEENADKCVWTYGATYTAAGGSKANMKLGGRDFLIQQNWVNAGAGACGLSYGQLSYQGGSGGGPYTMACPKGSVAVGLYGRGRSYVDQLGMLCAPVNANGTLGTALQNGTVGGSGGSAFSALCPSGQALVGVHGRSGSYVDQIGLDCQTLPTWASSGTVAYSASAAGGNGGGAFSSLCPRGHAINRITGRSGSYVDAEQPQCARLW